MFIKSLPCDRLELTLFCHVHTPQAAVRVYHSYLIQLKSATQSITVYCVVIVTGLRTTNDTVAWATGTVSDVAVGHWASNQPDMDSGDCVSGDLWSSEHLWSFGPCSQELPFVCQSSAIVEGKVVCSQLRLKLIAKI